jgi:3-deoxy-D-manno-octulosonic-acid transferase
VMGPHYANFRAITDDLRAHDALRIVERENLARVLVDLLCDRAAAEAMGVRALEVFASQAGATEHTLWALQAVLAEGAQIS